MSDPRRARVLPLLPTRTLARNFAAGVALPTLSLASHAARSGDPVIGRTLAESKPGTAPSLPVAKGAPNVIWSLLDDASFGSSGTFGGGARTPVLDSLTQNGLRYTNSHTNGVCSPSRTALLLPRRSPCG